MEEILETMIRDRSNEYTLLVKLFKELHAAIPKGSSSATANALGRAVFRLHKEIQELTDKLYEERAVKAKVAKEIGDAFVEAYEELHS
jgi:shikimate kinase